MGRGVRSSVGGFIVGALLVVLLSERPGRVQDILRVAPGRPRDRRDPTLLGLRVALLEALHLERSAVGVAG